MTPDEFRLLISEEAFQEAVVQQAELKGWWWWHDNFSRRNKPGLPDLILVRPPRLLFVELKKQNGRVSPAQKAVLAMLEQCPGVETYVWRPSDETALAKVLDRM